MKLVMVDDALDVLVCKGVPVSELEDAPLCVKLAVPVCVLVAAPLEEEEAEPLRELEGEPLCAELAEPVCVLLAVPDEEEEAVTVAVMVVGMSVCVCVWCGPTIAAIWMAPSEIHESYSRHFSLTTVRKQEKALECVLLR